MQATFHSTSCCATYSNGWHLFDGPSCTTHNHSTHLHFSYIRSYTMTPLDFPCLKAMKLVTNHNGNRFLVGTLVHESQASLDLPFFDPNPPAFSHHYFQVQFDQLQDALEHQQTEIAAFLAKYAAFRTEVTTTLS
ncbi:uncharacterized protein LOC127257751 [Andrographis paniculata]|uniref:uncharacterized protein LOC127257751 n=1 Tax=Andrographis paniculata TaxID=175694 RepID=UPI0021E74007|nr:uncharacterized protein LOC127257751 [Andrographis paniculata]